MQGKHGYAKQDWYGEWTLAFTRKESIRLLVGESTMTWKELRSEYGWRCSKVILTIKEV